MSTRDILQADLERSQQAGDFATQAEILMQLAKIAETEKEFSIAQGLYGQAWAAYQKMGDTANMAFTLSCLSKMLSLALFEAGRWPTLDFDQSAVYTFYETALAHYAEMGDLSRQAMTYAVMGGDADDNSEIDVAQRAYEKALVLYEAIDDRLSQAHILSRLGETYAVNEPEYEQFLARALALYQQLGNKDGEAHTFSALGEFYHSAHDYVMSRQYYENALKLCLSLKNDHQIQHITLRCLDAVQKIEDYKTYQEYHAQIRRMLQEHDMLRRIDLPVWKHYIAAAVDNQDFITARTIYHGLISRAAQGHYPEGQALSYWDWGEMEYKAGRQEMGWAICRYALSLMNHYRSYYRDTYQELFDKMQRFSPKALCL